jgi:hypothetical protein
MKYLGDDNLALAIAPLHARGLFETQRAYRQSHVFPKVLVGCVGVLAKKVSACSLIYNLSKRP